MPEKRETQIAMETEAGREGLEIWRRVLKNMSGEQKLLKAFELTEHVRQVMRAGIREAFPEASESELQRIYVDRMLSFHGTSLAELRRRQREEYGEH